MTMKRGITEVGMGDGIRGVRQVAVVGGWMLIATTGEGRVLYELRVDASVSPEDRRARVAEVEMWLELQDPRLQLVRCDLPPLSRRSPHS